MPELPTPAWTVVMPVCLPSIMAMSFLLTPTIVRADDPVD
jgi:hypothetical protein